MNKLYIIAVLLMGFTVMQGQITEMIIYETGGNTVTYQIANIDSIVYDTTAIATCPATFTDARDNEVYAVVQIGNQCWMAENLRYDVPSALGPSDTINPGSPSSYGRLYDWTTVMNGSTSSFLNPSGVPGICPSGWHLPSDSEWNEMELVLGMPAADTVSYVFRGTHGISMKSNSGWVVGNGTNSSGFNAVPAGFYRSSGFGSAGQETYFWSSTSLTANYPIWRVLRYDSSGVYRNSPSSLILASCRCIKD